MGTRALALSVPHLSSSLQMLPKAPGAQQACGTFSLSSWPGRALDMKQGEKHGPDPHHSLQPPLLSVLL